MGSTFGLGLVLSFVDNASTGMRSASNTFDQMSSSADRLIGSSQSLGVATQSMATMGTVLVGFGDMAMNAGTGIIDTYQKVGQTIIDTGAEFQSYRMRLNALYETPAEADNVLREMQVYAQESVFGIKGLIDSVTMMKVVGIDALNDVTSTTGQTTQRLMDYASDLAAMQPQMRNAYGTGVSAAMGAIREYIAEGNAMSLKRGASLDITALLGEDKGKTIEDRTRQIADLIEILNIAGYTESLFGTPQQILMNLEDYWINFLSDISDVGVFDKYADLLEGIQTIISDLIGDTEKYTAIVNIVADAVTYFLDLLIGLVDIVGEVVTAFTDWAKDNPELASTIIKLVGAAGALIAVLGVASKAMGSVFILLASFKMLGISGAGIFTTFGKALLGSVLPGILAIGVLKSAWERDLLGIQSIVQTVIKTIELTFKALFGSTDEAGNQLTLTKDDFIEAKDMGILPFIEAILQLKERLSEVVSGIVSGFESVIANVQTFLESVIPVTENFGGIIGQFGEWLKQFVDADSQIDWEGIGQSIGQVAAVVGMLFIALKIVTPVIGIFKNAFNLVKVLFVAIKPIIMGIGTVIGGISAPVWIVIGSIVALVAGFIYLWNTSEEFRNNMQGIADDFARAWENVKGIFQESIDNMMQRLQPVIEKFQGLGDKLREMGTRLQPVFMILAGVIGVAFAGIAGVVNGVIEALAPLADVVVSIVGSVMDVINGILAFLGGDFEGASASFQSALDGLADATAAIVETIGSFIDGFITGFLGTIDGFLGTDLVGGFNNIKEIIETALTDLPAFFTSLGENLYNGFIAIWDSTIGPFFEGVVSGVKGAFTGILQWFTNLGNNISGAFTGAWDTVVQFFTGIWTGITGAFTEAVTWFTNLGTDIWEAITGAFTGLATFGQDILDGLVNGISGGVESAIESVKGFFGNIWQGILDVFGIASPSTEAESAAGFILSGLVQGFETAVNGVIETVKGIFGGIWDAIKSVFGFGSSESAESKEAKSAGEDIVSGLESGLTGDTSKLETATATMASTVIDGLRTSLGVSEGSTESSITNAMGIAVVNGINTGLSSTTADLFATGASVVYNALNAALASAFGTTSAGFAAGSRTGATAFEPIGANIAQGIAWGLENSTGVINDALSKVSNASVLEVFTGGNDVLSSWTTLVSNIESAVSKLTSSVKGEVSKMTKAFSSATWRLPNIKTPRVTISGYLQPEPGIKIPQFKVSWNALGGIFNKPTIFNSTAGPQGVGESGAEAILPLTTLWDRLDSSIADAIETVASVSPKITVVPAAPVAATTKASTAPGTVSNNVSSSSNDNRVVFEAGSVVIQANGTGDADLDAVADKLIKKISRKMEKKNLVTRKKEVLSV